MIIALSSYFSALIVVIIVALLRSQSRFSTHKLFNLHNFHHCQSVSVSCRTRNFKLCIVSFTERREEKNHNKTHKKFLNSKKQLKSVALRPQFFSQEQKNFNFVFCALFFHPLSCVAAKFVVERSFYFSFFLCLTLLSPQQLFHRQPYSPSRISDHRLYDPKPADY